LVAAITGTLYAVIPQIDRVVHSHELTVDHIGDRELPMGEQIEAARRAHPEGTIAFVRPAPVAGETTRVALATDDVREGLNKTVFVDPYTGEVRGALPTYGQWLPVRTWFDDLHRNLHLGDFGRNYSEIAASWLWVVSLGGLILWIGYRRRTRKTRRLLVPDREAPKRLRTLSWHGSVGIWIIIGLIALSASGLSWSRFAGESISTLRTELSWTTPSPSSSPAPTVAVDPHATHDGGGGDQAASSPAVIEPSDFTRVMATADHQGLVGPLEITPPSEAGAYWQVSENARGYPSHFDSIAIDPHTFAVVDRVDFADWPIAAKLTEWAISAHMGLFGVVNQIVLVLLGIGLTTVIFRGYLMWWRRRGSSGLPTAPAIGALGSLKPVEAVALIGVVALTGWFVPWFGVPLGLFVLFDAARGLYLAKRDAANREGAL